ncbi:SDR family oxidoreductase [Streptomyces sp. NPDC091972]|uniref:SDR family oxidoreductase n=1 Tax=Streptomyces sp. NPDC091972 TaxID=3366007 RepID=UPI00381542DB
MPASTPAEKKVVLITGASSGIGEATARHLAAAGHQIMAGARRTDRLAELARQVSATDGELDHHTLDVTRRDSVTSFVDAALNRYGRIDALVNNAGVMPLAPMADCRVDEWDQMLDVNVRGTLYGIAAVLPTMREQGNGHIINIASVAGHRVDPTAAVYCATKYAVRALSEGLRQENRDIRVTIISPGFTESELLDRGGAAEAQTMARTAARQLAIPASAVAQAISYALHQPATVDVNEIVIRPTAQG